MVRLPYPWSGDSQGQETLLAPSADKQTRNHDTECSNHHLSLSTLSKVKGIEPWQDEMVSYIYKFTRNAIVRLPHPWSGDTQCQETFLAPSAIIYIIGKLQH